MATGAANSKNAGGGGGSSSSGSSSSSSGSGGSGGGSGGSGGGSGGGSSGSGGSGASGGGGGASGDGDPNRSALERALGIVTEVHGGEGVTALYLTLNVFLLLTAYYVIKPVREGLILAMASGAEYKSYLSAAIAIALLAAVPAYARVANRLPKNKLVVGVTLFFASHLVVFWILSKIPAAERNLGLLFFVWVGIFNMMVVAQFWAFANDLYTQEQGKRLFALVGIGASVGAALGAYVTGFLQDVMKLGTYELLLVSAMLLVGCAALTQAAYARERGPASGKGYHEMPPPFSRQTKPGNEEKDRSGAFGLVLSNRYLLYIAIFSLIFTWVNTNGEYMLSVLVKGRGAEEAIKQGIAQGADLDKFKKAFGTRFYADFFLWVNIFGVALQTFAVSRIVKFGGLKVAFFVLPVIAFFDSIAFLTLPALLAVHELSVLRPGKIAENSSDYSINNTVRNMLWLPTTTEMKYKAKQAVDTFFVRMGDVASAALVYVGGRQFNWPARNFAIVNAILVAGWLFLARNIVKENAELTKQKEEEEAAAEKAGEEKKPSTKDDDDKKSDDRKSDDKKSDKKTSAKSSAKEEEKSKDDKKSDEKDDDDA